jgi:hypothetical protein
MFDVGFSERFERLLLNKQFTLTFAAFYTKLGFPKKSDMFPGSEKHYLRLFYTNKSLREKVRIDT